MFGWTLITRTFALPLARGRDPSQNPLCVQVPVAPDALWHGHPGKKKIRLSAVFSLFKYYLLNKKLPGASNYSRLLDQEDKSWKADGKLDRSAVSNGSGLSKTLWWSWADNKSADGSWLPDCHWMTVSNFPGHAKWSEDPRDPVALSMQWEVWKDGSWQVRWNFEH